MKTRSKSSSPRSALTRAAFGSLLTLGVSAGFGVFGLISPAQAADDIWVYGGDPNNPLASTATSGGGTGNFDDGPAGYWSLGVKPTNNANNAIINNGGTVNITANETPVDVIVDSIAGGSGTYNQTAGTVTQSVGWFRLGTAANTALAPQSNYNLSGGTITDTAGVGQQFNIAENTFSNVQMTISGTGAVTGGNFGIFQIGAAANSVGILNVNTGGTFNFSPTVAPTGTGLNASGNTVSIGNAGTGTLNINGGTVNFQPTVGGNFPLVVGRASTANGTVNLASGTLNVGSAAAIQEMWIGNAGTGAISATPTGTLNVSGGTLNVSSWLALGRNTTNNGGTGAFTLSGGTVNAAINSGNVSLSGTGTTSVGTTNVTGGSLNTPNAVYVTEGGQGTLSISGTGVVSEFSGTGLRINTTAATNTVATGTVNLGDGTNLGASTLSVNNVNTVNTTAARSIFNFNGGVLQAKANNATFFGSATGTLGAGVANVRNGGAIIDSNGVNITVTQALTHSNIAGDNATDGGLTKVGIGALTLTGANSYTGNTTINAGALDAQVTGSLPGLNTAGRVNVGAAGALVVGVGYSTGQTVGDIDTARASNTFATGGSIGLDIAAAATGSTYATNLTPTVTTDFYKLGAGSLNLTGANTYTGTTYLYNGVLSGNIGTGALQFNGGNLQLNAASAANLTNEAVSFNGTAVIDTNGNNATISQPITGLGGGFFVKQGAGTLTFTGGFNFSPTRAYTPVAANLGSLFVQGGTLTLSGASEVLNTGGNFSSIGQNPGNFGTLNVVNGATYTAGDLNIADVGGASATTPVNALNGGTLNLGAGSTITENNLFVGKGGGTTTNGVLAIGVLNQTGGTFTANQNSQIGVFGQGQYNLSGGTFTQAGGPYTSVARQTGGFGVVDVSGTGVFNGSAAGGRLIVGESGTGVLNVRNGGTVNVNSTTNATVGNLGSAVSALTLGNTVGATGVAGGTGIVNLLPGGTINTPSIGGLNATGTNGTTGILNLSGGTLANTAATTTFIQNLTQANVYGNVGGTAVGGAVFNTTNGNATVAQALVAPAGQGITSIAATGTGFTTTPIVQITGGGGTGATALATVDANGNVTGFTVTNPGTNYTTAPTVTLSGPSGATATTTANIGANVSGGLTKLGLNTLTLSGANTYTGVTAVNAGALTLGAAGSITTSSQISIASAAAFNVSAAFTSPTTQTINGLGALNGGTFALHAQRHALPRCHHGAGRHRHANHYDQRHVDADGDHQLRHHQPHQQGSHHVRRGGAVGPQRCHPDVARHHRSHDDVHALRRVGG